MQSVLHICEQCFGLLQEDMTALWQEDWAVKSAWDWTPASACEKSIEIFTQTPYDLDNHKNITKRFNKFDINSNKQQFLMKTTA